MEKTLILLKPDALQRGLIGRIVNRFEAKGFKIVAMKLMRVSRELAERHYAEHQGKGFYAPLLDFITAAPIVALVLEGNDAVRVTRSMIGSTFGPDAAAGTIRGDFGLSKRYNLIHGSDSPATAEREIALYFSRDELLEYARPGDVWTYAQSGNELI